VALQIVTAIRDHGSKVGLPVMAHRH
jgi:hypothetical protein